MEIQRGMDIQGSIRMILQKRRYEFLGEYKDDIPGHNKQWIFRGVQGINIQMDNKEYLGEIQDFKLAVRTTHLICM